MGFTGEQTDANGQLYLRARYYKPSIGIFSALDPFEGDAMSLLLVILRTSDVFYGVLIT